MIVPSMHKNTGGHNVYLEKKKKLVIVSMEKTMVTWVHFLEKT